MNIIQAATATVGLIAAIGGISWAGLNEFRAIEQRSDAKYVPLDEWQDFQWSQIKRDIRAIEKEIAEAEFRGMEDYAEKLQDELDDLTEFLCRKYPDDRDC